MPWWPAEVKDLANQTARATNEITSQIADIQQATEESVQAIVGITTSIGDLSEIASTIAAAVEEQGATTQTIAHNVRTVGNDAASATQNVVDLTRSSMESYASTIRVIWSSQDLGQLTEDLNREVQDFLIKIRA